MGQKEAYVIDVKDNVATIISDRIRKGDSFEVSVAGKSTTITARSDIPYGHKVAIAPIHRGDQVMKYGLSLGTAVTEIAVGDHVHVHNMESNRGRGDRFFAKEARRASHWLS